MRTKGELRSGGSRFDPPPFSDCAKLPQTARWPDTSHEPPPDSVGHTLRVLLRCNTAGRQNASLRWFDETVRVDTGDDQEDRDYEDDSGHAETGRYTLHKPSSAGFRPAVREGALGVRSDRDGGTLYGMLDGARRRNELQVSLVLCTPEEGAEVLQRHGCQRAAGAGLL